MIKRALPLVVAMLIGWPAVSAALPLYGARSGRTCDNCHSLPNSWYDPPESSRRKCTLSCVSCHVDPSGGGLRNVSGRYFGQSTLPMFGAKGRPLYDQQRDLDVQMMKLFGPTDPDAARRGAPSSQPSGGPPSSQPSGGPPSSQPSSQPSGGFAIDTEARDPRGPNAAPTHLGPAFGTPYGHQSSEMSWLEGRYGDHMADPLVLVGGDVRLGVWLPLVFPMQGDLYAAVQPIEHLTIATTVGVRGRMRDPLLADVLKDDQPKVGVRDAWIMTHEWPYMSYLRAGRFLPAFGTRIADHTAYTRRPFGMSQENPANRVIGVEAGLAPNYPHLTASVFKPSSLDAIDPFELGDGWGAAVNGGWRDLAWQLGGSAMVRRRSLETGGDTTDFSVQWALNPWRWWWDVPITYLGESTFGLLQRPFSGKETSQIAQYHQLAWTASNGLVARLRYDFWDPDREVKDDEIQRPGVGLDWTLFAGLTISGDVRVGMPAGGNPSGDTFFQLHGWF